MSKQNQTFPDNPQIQVLKSGKTGLFTNYIFKAIPLAFDESLSYYECLCGLLDYLKNVIIPTVNNNADAVAELQNLYIELKTYVDNAINEYEESINNKVESLENYMNDYFNNLDVQQEINNKLDQMVEDGTLQKILNNYISITKVYNTFSDVLNDSLTDGMKIKTLGYYDINDNGGCNYLVTNIKNTNIKQIEKDNLFIEPIFNDVINLKCYGLHGNDNDDDSILLNELFNYFNNKTLYIPNGIYSINQTLYIGNNCNLIMDNKCELKANSFMDYLLVYNKEDLSYENKTHDKYIKGGILNGNNKINDSVITLRSYMHFTLQDMVIKNFSLYGLKTKFNNITAGNELICNNLYFWNETEQQNSLAIYNIARDGIFTNILIRDTHYGIECYDGLYSKIHGWIGFASLIPNSYFIKSNDKATIIDECYADTYQFPFISSFLTLNISNSLILFNTQLYTSELVKSNKPIIFKSEKDVYGLNTYGSFNAHNNRINNADISITLTNKTNNLNKFNNSLDTNKNVDFTNYQDETFKLFYASIGSDVNNLNRPGIWYVNNASNLPSGAYEFGIIYVIATPIQDSNYMDTDINIAHLQQIYIPIGSDPNGIYVRNKTGDGWQNWKQSPLSSI